MKCKLDFQGRLRNRDLSFLLKELSMIMHEEPEDEVEQSLLVISSQIVAPDFSDEEALRGGKEDEALNQPMSTSAAQFGTRKVVETRG